MVSTLLSMVAARSNWQVLNGTMDMQKGNDDTGNSLVFSYYSELNDDT